MQQMNMSLKTTNGAIEDHMWRVDFFLGSDVVWTSPAWAETDNEACVQAKDEAHYRGLQYDGVRARKAANIYEASGV